MILLDTTKIESSFVEEAISAPTVLYSYDYIIIGGGTAGCPLAATLSQNSTVLVLERGGSPYVNTSKLRPENFISTITDNSPDSYSQAFISEDGVFNRRARVLGGGTVINGGFYSHAETVFLGEAGLDESLVNDSYRWVEKKLVFEPAVLQWKSAMRDGLVEAGVLPYNGFTYDHINGTKIGGTIFDRDGNRHSAADLLEYANPERIKVYLHATVLKIMLTTKANGVIFEDAMGRKHWAVLTNESKSEIILSAGAIGSPQLLLLSGIGPSHQLDKMGIKVVIDQPMVGQGMADNPSSGLYIPSPRPVELSLISVVGITLFGGYIEATSGLNYASAYAQRPSNDNATILNKSSMTLPAAMDDTASFDLNSTNVGSIFEKIKGPISRGQLGLRSTNPNDNPKVTFNYFQESEDLTKCVKGMETVIDVISSKSFSKFRYRNITTQALLDTMVKLPLNLRPKHPNSATSLEQFCIDTVTTLWHYHGACQVGKVVDQDYKVIGIDGLRVIDASTFNFSPGTNPQATIMMLGR
ncbi:protein HOTHEAD-like [Durio zibethinus]|uniref:Protein HOTHEAD-like n=1 Tax=Durio zibethinus TaxID=66656 RepID=A0A6P5YD71_DURZI|nr:protein HOTHEAD-like [Durio zibethinus]